jgi:hypothetical protein
VSAPFHNPNGKRRRFPLIPDMYLVFGAWLILLGAHFMRPSDVIDSMLATSFGGLMMGLQAGLRRMDTKRPRTGEGGQNAR